jgi:hypothetical protein
MKFNVFSIQNSKRGKLNSSKPSKRDSEIQIDFFSFSPTSTIKESRFKFPCQKKTKTKKIVINKEIADKNMTKYLGIPNS